MSDTGDSQKTDANAGKVAKFASLMNSGAIGLVRFTLDHP
jgi:hypothetical protein